MEDLYSFVNPLNERHSPMISKETLDIILANKDVRKQIGVLFLFLCNVIGFLGSSFRLFCQQRLNSAIIFDRDFSYNFFGFKVG